MFEKGDIVTRTYTTPYLRFYSGDLAIILKQPGSQKTSYKVFILHGERSGEEVWWSHNFMKSYERAKITWEV